MAEFNHDFGYDSVCRYCGVREEAVQDGLASPICDIVRHNANLWTAVIVVFGIIFCSIPLFGLFE